MSSNVATASTNPVAQLILANHKAIRTVLPKHMSADRMARLALVSCRRNPKLLAANPASFIGALITASQLGLEPGVAGMGELIPFKDEVQFVPGYRGLMDLARRSGQVGSINAETVHEHDTFEYTLGTNPFVRHLPATGDRGDVTHVYATAHLISSGDWQFKIMTKVEVEAVRKKSKAGNFGPWKDHWPEMAKKTAIRALCKMLPMSIEVQRAVSLDELADAGVPQGTAVELPDDFSMEIQPTSEGAK